MPASAIQFPWSDAELDARVSDAVREYWAARNDQSGKQKDLGRVDTGMRGEVTGGQHLSAFTKLCAKSLTLRVLLSWKFDSKLASNYLATSER